MPERVEVAVVGAGQAGLAISYYLTQRGRTHVVLEKNRHVGSAWRHERWDSFTLVMPNWAVRLPGFPYRGDDPDGFMTRAEIVSHLEQYASSFGAPVRFGVTVTAVDPAPGERLRRLNSRRRYLRCGECRRGHGLISVPQTHEACRCISPAYCAAALQSLS